MPTIEDARALRLSNLKAALRIGKPMDEFSIIELAITRIKALETGINEEHNGCVKTARDVMPDELRDVKLLFAHQACWTMAAEIRRMRAELERMRSETPKK